MAKRRETLDTITVAELIALLEEQDPDAKVVFTADYGDYHHTSQALPVRGRCEDAVLVESAYSHSGFALLEEGEDEDVEDEDGDVEAQGYVVIR